MLLAISSFVVTEYLFKMLPDFKRFSFMQILNNIRLQDSQEFSQYSKVLRGF